jgi:uncharacterized CHY-type Zn-finger protein
MIGCRAGDECPFIHDAQLRDEMGTPPSESSEGEPVPNMVQDRRQAVKEPERSRVVSKPVSKVQKENPREFELGQLRRRYSPKETVTSVEGQSGSTILRFKLAPSDPDFPFEMEALDCSVVVPPGYPDEKPRLSVKNNDIPRGFALNIESGFDGLIEKSKSRPMTLLSLMKELDKNLEAFLSEKKAETITLVANADIRHLQNLPVRAVAPPKEPTISTTEPVQAPVKRSEPAVFYTEEQKVEAKKRRDMETRQLEARLGRLPLFMKSSDTIEWRIPLEPRKKQALPLSLQAVKSTKLFVPLLYPLQPCGIKLDGVYGEEARTVEDAFEARAKAEKALNLMGHINYLSVNMHVFAQNTQPIQPVEAPITSVATPVAAPEESGTEKMSGEDDRSHIKHIPRPPEWDIVDGSDLEDSSDGYSYDSGDESDPGGVEVGEVEGSSSAPTSNAEKGTSISFPFLEMYDIELLEITTLNVTIKCERCKASMDITGLKDGQSKHESCKKCASNLIIGFRKELLHANAVRAGFLDLEGCSIVDLLPSTFVPTCAQCSTPFTTGVVSVRGDTTTNVCRECHQKFSFKLPEIKFLRISSAHLPPSTGPRRKKESLGLTSGAPLPRNGRCKHYAKSYRWFRFSCCQKVYACDRCHDEAEEHANEHGNRMICGYCSREQIYRPEACGVCRAVLIGRVGSGFWEGGKGTRDKVRMSRKDPRKYKRRPGTKVGKS